MSDRNYKADWLQEPGKVKRYEAKGFPNSMTWQEVVNAEIERDLEERVDRDFLRHLEDAMAKRRARKALAWSALKLVLGLALAIYLVLWAMGGFH